MKSRTTLVAILSLTSAALLVPVAQPAMASPAPASNRQSFDRFFAAFRAAVLAGDRATVAGMVSLPFKDFAGGEVDRSAGTQAQFLAHYDQIFSPAVIAAIRAGKVRAFESGRDDGEAPGPIAKGEYLLDAAESTDQLVFSPRHGQFRLTRIPFYS